MIYDLPKIEATQIEKAHKARLYKVERDRLKSRLYVYMNYPKINYHGLNLSEAKKYVYADFIARYQRLIGRNVLFSIGYNNIDTSIYKNISKLDKPIYSFCASEFHLYQKELKLLDISFDEEKEILFSSEDYVKYVQQVFLMLYEKKIITLKHGLVVYDEEKIYQKGEYLENNGKYYSLNGAKLSATNKNYYALKLTSIKKELQKEIENLNVAKEVKLALLDKLCYKKEYEIKCITTQDEILKIKMVNPEFICGISYICLNPNYMDITPFITTDECGDIEFIKENLTDGLIYSGTNLINPIISSQIPIFISSYYDEDIHVGIPSLSDSEEAFVSLNELDFNPVIDYINGDCILVNSGRFNGMSLMEAYEKITDYLLSENLAILHNEVKLEELIISTNIKFGIPVPLHVEQTPASIPVVHNLRHDVKLELGELADKTLVREFLCDEFSSYLLPNAIRLKGDTGILDFESMEALNEIGLFKNLDISLLDYENHLNDIMWHMVLNRLFSRYYTEGFDCSFKKLLFVKPILDESLRQMHRNNNNLISISDLIYNKGASVIRSYYAASGMDEECSIYNVEDMIEMEQLIEKIVKVYYYPIDDFCVDLDIHYQRLVDKANLYAQNNDFKNYFETIISFVKKVHEIKHISRAQAKGLLIILSVIVPSLSEQIKEDVFNIREPLYYFSWPE